MKRARLTVLFAAVLTASVLLSAQDTQAAGSREREFIWAEASARIATARTEADFLGAARVYGDLVRDKVRNGPLFYNLGIALLMGGQYDEALTAFIRAERYQGSDPEIRRNILLARAKGNADADLRLPWYRYLLFWHYGLAAKTRLSMAVVSFILFWTALALRRFKRTRTIRALLFLSLCVLVFYGSSTAATLLQENREETRALFHLKPEPSTTEAQTPS